MMVLRNGPNAKATPSGKIRPAVDPDDLVSQASPWSMQNRQRYFVVDLSSNQCTEEDFAGLREEICNNFGMEIGSLFDHEIDSCSALSPHFNDEVFDSELADYLRSIDVTFFDKDNPHITRAPGDRNNALSRRMVFIPGMNLALVISSVSQARLYTMLSFLEDGEDFDDVTDTMVQERMRDYLGDDIGIYSFKDGFKRLINELGVKSETAERVAMAEEYNEARKKNKKKKAVYITHTMTAVQATDNNF